MGHDFLERYLDIVFWEIWYWGAWSTKDENGMMGIDSSFNFLKIEMVDYSCAYCLVSM